MDGATATQKNHLAEPTGFSGKSPSSPVLVKECRNLIDVLSGKVDRLCQEHREDREREGHIKSLTDSLVTLNTVLKSLEQEKHVQIPGAVFEDAQGITYQSVSSCELERWFSVK